MSTPSNGWYTMNIKEAGDIYYIGPAQDDPVELGLHEHLVGYNAPAFKFTNTPGTDEYSIWYEGKWVNFNKEFKLCLSHEAGEQWKLVPVANIGYVIKGGPGKSYCWTQAAFTPGHLGLGSPPPKTCIECCDQCLCTYEAQCNMKDKGCPCKDPLPENRIRDLVNKGTLAIQGKTVLASSTGCSSHCDIVTLTRVHGPL